MYSNLLKNQLLNYKPAYNEDTSVLDSFEAFIEQHKNCFDRELLEGHITGSAWIVDKSRRYVLLTHHRKIGSWFQLGGHCDGCHNVCEVALKEAREESGLARIAVLSDAIFDLDIHVIPEYKGIPEHKHYDVRFLFEADRRDLLMISSESKDLRWVKIEDLEEYSQESSILRMAEKLAK